MKPTQSKTSNQTELIEENIQEHKEEKLRKSPIAPKQSVEIKEEAAESSAKEDEDKVTLKVIQTK